eukprot:1136205-Pelagomonas_calceolata.AAC.8
MSFLILHFLTSDTLTATRLALKLHAHSVQYAYKRSSTRRALEQTPLDSHRQAQARATASNPPDPHWLIFVSLGEGDTRCLGPSYPLFLD